MEREPIFPSEVLHAIIGGSSALDLPRLYLSDLIDASRFLAGYGFEWELEAHREELEEIRIPASRSRRCARTAPRRIARSSSPPARSSA